MSLCIDTLSVEKEFVFCKVVEDLPHVEISPDVPPETYSAGDMLVARYGQIRDYVFDGKMWLI